MLGNLILRGNVYSVRLFIPLEFQKIIGRRELVRSLKTNDKEQAILKLRRLQSGVQRLFFMVRSGMIDRGQLTVILLNFILISTYLPLTSTKPQDVWLSGQLR
jgi:hypothetical protein